MGARQAGEILEGSFSSVSTSIFATKYKFCSVKLIQDLQDFHTSALLQFQNFLIFSISESSQFLREFPRSCKFQFLSDLSTIFDEVSRFAEIGNFYLRFSQNVVGIAGNPR